MAFDERLLSRIEDAGINASAPPQQLWLDGWIVRFSPGKAKRARCVNAVAPGRLPLEQKLRLASRAIEGAGLPFYLRITPFTQPGQLDAELARRGFSREDDTRVMVCTRPASMPPPPLPAGTHWRALEASAYAAAVGEMRGSPAPERQAHADRLACSPVPYRGWAIVRDSDASVLACGQYAREAELVGLYDVHTHEAERGRGLAGLLCERMLSLAALEGAEIAYLQVDSANRPARTVYQRMGFADAYAYHYRRAPEGGAAAG